MPHVVLKGSLTPEDIWLAFRPLEFHEKGVHYKASECFLDSTKTVALVRSLVVERDFPKNFLLRISENDGEMTLALEILGAPERTDAVKRFIGLCAWQILQAEPSLEIARTNIEEQIKAPEG